MGMNKRELTAAIILGGTSDHAWLKHGRKGCVEHAWKAAGELCKMSEEENK
jgi:hypothetical protein